MVNLRVFQQPTRPQVQVQYDPQQSDLSSVPLNTTITFTCTSTGGRPPANLTWNGKPASATPTYTSSNDSQGVGDATSTFNFTTAEYGVTYSVYCRARGPDPIQKKNLRRREANVGGIVGGIIGALAGVGVMAAVVFFVVRKKRADRGEKDGDVGDLSDRQYENVPNPMMVSQRPGSGSDEYEVPMETIQPLTGSDDEYEVPMETVQPPQSSDDYQELRPAVYQSLQRGID
ncbi:PREDICTED: uncharacterized protein LOC109486660 [Branchiostoma belcheri]|uniref:Uncharacterized protein LOC109486660 n=1 Tax=Branchiostoma belcheri TaxID=7741 RepID=A0A6P5AVW5_BRABE|nr:PREDICTED: uncharacterized protein LOC109486660 [Branchiostoma belcheri]